VLRGESPNLLDRSALLAVEAARRASGLEIDRSLRAAVGLLPALLFETRSGKPIQAVAISPRGSWAAAGGDDGIVRVWNSKDGSEIARIEHGAPVRSVVISPGGSYLASASKNGVIVRVMKSGQQIRLAAPGTSVLAFNGGLLASGGSSDGRISLWDVARAKEVRRLWRDDGAATAIAFSPDRRLMVAGGGNTVQVWDPSTGSELMRGRHRPASASMPLRLGSRDGGVFAVAFHPGGQYVVSGGQDHAVSLWEIASGREVFRAYLSDSVYAVGVSPDGRWLAAGGMDETARVWSLQDGSERYRLQHKYVVQKLLWTADNDLLTVSGDGTARLWSMATGRELSRMYDPDYIIDAALSADGRHGITGDWVNGVVRIWTLSRGGAVLSLIHPAAREAVYSPDGTHLATIGETNYVQLWQLPEGKPLYRFVHEPYAVGAVFSPDGKILLTTGWDGVAHLWDVGTGKLLATLAHQGRIVDAKFSAGRPIVVTAGFEDGTAGVWEVPSGRELFRLKHEGAAESVGRVSPGGGVRELSFDAGGRTLATCGQDGTVRLWDLQDGRELKRFTLRGFAMRAVFTPDGRHLVTDSERDVSVYSLSTGERLADIDKQAAKDEFMSVLGMSPDGRWLLVGSPEEHSVQVRTLPELKVVARLLHDDDVFTAVFNKDGSRLLTASRDKSARIWDTGSWQERTRVAANDFMYSASYSPDEKFFVTASGDGQVQVWAAGLDAMVRLACARLRRNLAPEEWRQYLGAEKVAPTCPRQPAANPPP
jgi:WD40 repeat protein